MELFILRKDPAWTIKARHPMQGQHPSMSIQHLQRLRQCFHTIAQRHGSHATWLPETGFLVTDDNAEAERGFPYEMWLDQALRETGNGARRHSPVA